MKILFIATKYDYGNPSRGLSYEYYNFWDTLVRMNNKMHSVKYFPYDEMILKYGKEKMNRMLLETVRKDRPDLCFFVFSYEIGKETVREISKSGAVTYSWFSDDIWRFESFSRYYAPLFDYVSTTDYAAMDKYNAIHYKNAILTQFACNHFLYKPQKSKKNHNVTFIGQKYGSRGEIADAVEQKGFGLECWGGGWPKGRVSQKEMIEIFSNSRININLSASSPSTKATLKDIAAIFLRKDMDRKIRAYGYKEWIPRMMLRVKKQQRQQIKGRTFEISGCGGFQLSDYAEGLERYYDLNREIRIFNDANDLIKNIGYYLENDEERKKIALSGYRRTMKEHTYEKRFNRIFKEMKL